MDLLIDKDNLFIISIGKCSKADVTHCQISGNVLACVLIQILEIWDYLRLIVVIFQRPRKINHYYTVFVLYTVSTQSDVNLEVTERQCMMSHYPLLFVPGLKETEQTGPLNSGHMASIYLSETDSSLNNLAPVKKCHQEYKPESITSMSSQ